MLIIKAFGSAHVGRVLCLVSSVILHIQVDPLRSLAKNKPEFGAFRVYPPEFAAPQNETPDGKIVTDDNARIERWGTYWNRCDICTSRSCPARARWTLPRSLP